METYYPELRRMAGRLMKREGAGDTWQPTVLINELFLELVRMKRLPDDPQSIDKLPPDAFLGLAGHIMKRLLIHHARPLYKRDPAGCRGHVGAVGCRQGWTRRTRRS